MLTDNSLHLLKELFKYSNIHKIKLSKESSGWLYELFIKIKNIQKDKLEYKEIIKCNISAYNQNGFIGDTIKKDMTTIKDCKLFNILNTDIIIDIIINI